MGKAYFECTEEFLLEALSLPPGTRLIGARFVLAANSFRFVVEHKDITSVFEGETIPRLPWCMSPPFKQQEEAT